MARGEAGDHSQRRGETSEVGKKGRSGWATVFFFFLSFVQMREKRVRAAYNLRSFFYSRRKADKKYILILIFFKLSLPFFWRNLVHRGTKSVEDLAPFFWCEFLQLFQTNTISVEKSAKKSPKFLKKNYYFSKFWWILQNSTLNYRRINLCRENKKKIVVKKNV